MVAFGEKFVGFNSVLFQATAALAHRELQEDGTAEAGL